MQIQLKDLEIFVKVAEHHSFTKAADMLYVAQPSLSKSVQKLEREFKTTLLDRSNRKIRLTDAGMIVYEKSKEILSILENVSVSLNELSELVTGHMKIGLPQIIGTCFSPKIAKLYNEKFPGVTLEIKEEGGLITEKLVEKGLLDIGLVVLLIKNKNLTTIPTYRDDFVLCVSSHHPFAKAKAITLSDLKEESFIMFTKSFTLHGLIMDACKNEGYVPKVVYESSQWDLMLELVSAQLGIAIVPRLLANKLNNVDIVSIPINNSLLVWNIGLITNNNSYQSVALKAFINTVKDVYPTNLTEIDLRKRE